MKNILYIVSLLLFVITLNASEKELVITGDKDYAPYSYLDANEEAQGLFIDLWKEWANTTNTKIKFKLTDSLQATQLITDVHDKNASSRDIFTLKSLYKIKASLFARKGYEQQLFNQKVGVLNKFYGDKLKRDYPQIKIVHYHDYPSLVQDIHDKKLDLFFDSTEHIVDRYSHTELDIFFEALSKISNLIHSLQTERGTSTAFIASDRKRFTQEFATSIEKSDQSIDKLQKFLHKSFSKYPFTEKFSQILKNTYLARKNIKLGTTNLVDTYKNYTSAIRVLLLKISNLNEKITYPSLSNKIYSYSMLLMYKESLGQKRAALNALFLQEKHYDIIHDLYIKSDTRENIYLRSFLHTANTDTTECYYKTLDPKVLSLVSELEEKAKRKLKGERIDFVDSIAEDWFKQITLKINLVKQVERRAYTDILDSLIFVKKEYKDELIFNTPYQIIPLQKTYFSPVTLFTSKKNTNSFVEKGFKNIPLSTLKQIEEKWIDPTNRFYASSTTNMIQFTPQEQKWIDTHTVKIGVEPWAPIVFLNDNNQIDGVSGDFTKAIIKSTGLKVEYIAKEWKVLLDDFKNNKLDILPDVYKNSEREKFAHFSSGYFKMKDYIYIHKDNNTIHSMEDLNGKTLAIQTGNGNIEIIKEIFPKITILSTIDAIDSIDKVLNGEADALYAGQLIVDSIIKIEAMTEIKGIRQKSFKAPALHFTTQKHEVILQSIIQKGLDNISYSDKQKILNTWTVKKGPTINLTADEKDWLNKHKTITFTGDPNWLPYEAFDKSGKYLGIMADYLLEIESILGIEFQKVPASDWAHAVEMFKNSQVDVITETVNDKQSELMNFTQPVLKNSLIIAMHSDNDFIKDLNKIKDKKIVMIKDYGYVDEVQKKYPHIKFHLVKNIQEGLNGVSIGEYDAIVAMSTSITYSMSEMGINNLKIVGDTGIHVDIAWGVRKDYTILLSILDKALQNISMKERSAILSSWVQKQTVDTTDYVLMFQILGALLLVTAFIVFNNYKLKSMVERKTHEIQNLLKAFDKNVIASKTDKTGRITYVSEAFCDVSGFTQEDLIGKSHNIMRHPDMAKEIYDDLWKTIKAEKIWTGEIKNLKKNGDEYWVYAIITPECTPDGVCGYSAIRQDITDKKAVEDFTVNLEIKIQERTIDLANAKKEIELTHKHTRESIEYAARIQGAILPEELLISHYFKDNFIHWLPKDTVGGDIWLFDELRDKNECLLFFIDCTGHGVPGAFVTMIVKAVEREIIAKIEDDEHMEISPAWIMSYFNKSMKQLLRQETKDSQSNAGWDGGIIYYNKKTQILKFAGAETPLFYIDENQELQTIKGNRYSVGYKKCDMDYKYKETVIKVKEGMKFYCTTDGYLDQNGGEKDFPFGKKRFSKIIKENHSLSMQEQKDIFLKVMNEYELMIEDNDRNDDMTLIAFEIDKTPSFPRIVSQHKGLITQEIITQSIDTIEKNIDNIGLMSNISTIVIELAQNMMNHSKKENNSQEFSSLGSYTVSQESQELYRIKSENILSLKDKEKIELKLLNILSSDIGEIKRCYKELRKSGKDKHDRGAGIGFYEIAKISQNIKFEFSQMNEESFTFSFNVLVSNKQKART